jgi:hypothetical protein
MENQSVGLYDIIGSNIWLKKKAGVEPALD